MLNESLQTDQHPLISFREGAGGVQRPALVGTRLYVWQILDTLRASGNSVADAAEYLGLSELQVRAVIEYYADVQDEVEAHADEEREVERRERERWERAQRVLGERSPANSGPPVTTS